MSEQHLTCKESQRGLDGQSKALQNELWAHSAFRGGGWPFGPWLRLSKVAYTVGQRDHELKALAPLLQATRALWSPGQGFRAAGGEEQPIWDAGAPVSANQKVPRRLPG